MNVSYWVEQHFMVQICRNKILNLHFLQDVCSSPPPKQKHLQSRKQKTDVWVGSVMSCEAEGEMQEAERGRPSGRPSVQRCVRQLGASALHAPLSVCMWVNRRSLSSIAKQRRGSGGGAGRNHFSINCNRA